MITGRSLAFKNAAHRCPRLSTWLLPQRIRRSGIDSRGSLQMATGGWAAPVGAAHPLGPRERHFYLACGITSVNPATDTEVTKWPPGTFGNGGDGENVNVRRLPGGISFGNV